MNVRTVSANIWQNNKTGNSGDPYSSSLYNNHVEQQQACTNTYQTLNEKVTQPTSSNINFIRRGNETLTKHSETLTLNDGSNAMATKQISHDLNSNENTIYAFSEKNNRNNKYSHDDQGNNQQNEYHLILLNRNMNGADECKIYHNNIINNKNNNISDNNDNVVQMPSLSLLSHHHHNHHYHQNNIHPQMPSSQQQQQQQKFVQTQKFTNNPVSLTTNNVSNDAQYDASTALLNVPCTSSVLSFQNCSNNEYQMTTTEMAASIINNYEYDNKLNVDANSNSVDVQKMMNCVNVECYINNNNNNNSKNNEIIDNELQSSEQTTMNAQQTTASADNLIITSAIENISTAAATAVTTTTHGTPNKTEKYSNDIITMREKRRRDRRDRRLARTRALNGSGQSEILPDVLNNNNPRPPPYSSLPSQPIIPSIISTVPVNDTRYIFSLPLVRR